MISKQLIEMAHLKIDDKRILYLITECQNKSIQQILKLF